MHRAPRVTGLSHNRPSSYTSNNDGIRDPHDAHFYRIATAPTARSYSASAAACADRKKHKLLHRRLRGAHVPASTDNATRYVERDEQLETLDHIKFSAIGNSPATYTALLRWCAKLDSCMSGMLLHHHIIKDGLDHMGILQNLLVQMYIQYKLMYDATCMFNSILFRDAFSWNFMIRACSRYGKITETTEMFERMLGEGVAPNKFIYTSILFAYSSHEVHSQGERLHARLICINFVADSLLGNALVSMYCKCGDLDDARQLFDGLYDRDVVSWNAMVAAHSKQGQGKDALYFYKEMQQNGIMPNEVTFVSVLDACAHERVIFEGTRLHACFAGSRFESDIVLGTALVNLYGKHGDVMRAWKIFDLMVEQSTVSWNGMITAYVLHSQAKNAVVVFDQMLQQGTMPDKFIFVSMFSAHATKEDLPDGKRMYSRLFGSDFRSDTVVRTAVLNMFCKCGSMKDAEEIFDNTQDADDVLWTSMISGYAQHGQGKKALQVFKRMQLEGPRPSQVTYSSVLSACSREGLVDEGVRYLLSMSRDHGIKPIADHYNCIVDLLARSGRLDEAEDLITSMSCEVTHISWTSLLDACRKHSDLERGRRTAERMFLLDPDTSSPYVLLSNITASC